MLGPTIMTNRYHVSLIRGQLTQNLGRLFADINDEIIQSIDDNFPLTHGNLLFLLNGLLGLDR